MIEPFSKRGREWEPIGLELRGLLSLQIRDRLDPWKLAERIGLMVFDGQAALTRIGEEERSHLLGPGQSCWSGGVFPTPLPDGRYLCILNPNHSHRRNKITLMEEVVHTHRKHRPSGLAFADDGVKVRHYDKKQEEEAYGVGAAALLPWRPFFLGVNRGRTIDELAEDYDVTPDLVKYRINITGAYNLYRARQRSRV